MDEIEEKLKIEGLLKEVLLASLSGGQDVSVAINNVRDMSRHINGNDEIDKYSGLEIVQIIKGKDVKATSVFGVVKALNEGASPQDIVENNPDIFVEE